MIIMKKPRVVEKLRHFHRMVRKNGNKMGTYVRGIDFNYNNSCNFRCQHCFTEAPKALHNRAQLSFEKIAEVADQADDLGIFEFDMQGGELLLRPKLLFQLIEAIKPERFYLYLTTNGFLMDKEMAEKLAEAGVDRVSVSVDSIHPEEHDKFRGKKGAHEKALEALEHIKNAGMAPYLNITVGHYNAKSDDVRALLDYSKDHGYITLINVATPAGSWRGNLDVMVNEDDLEYLGELRKEYGNIIRDIWDSFDKKHENILGCNAVNRTYITPAGDVLPCPYLHIKIGNVHEQSLQDIVKYGFSVKHFHDHNDLCLAGEDKAFASKFLDQEMGVFNPVDAKTMFGEEDYVSKEAADAAKAYLAIPPSERFLSSDPLASAAKKSAAPAKMSGCAGCHAAR